MVAAGAAAAVGFRAVSASIGSDEAAANAPLWGVDFGAIGLAGLAALSFVCGAQVRVRRFHRRCPISFRLAVAGAPLYLVACALSAYVMLPQLTLTAAFVLGVVLMLNGAAFDRGAVKKTRAPAAVKTAVRMESAAVIAFGAPIASLAAAAAATPSLAGPGGLAALGEAGLSVVKGFGLGGGAGLSAALVLNAVLRPAGGRDENAALWRKASAFVAFAGVLAFLAAPAIGADQIVAAASAGLLWGEQTAGGVAARLALRRLAERAVIPLAYLGLGWLAVDGLVQADLLAVVFALTAVGALRIATRLAVLQPARLDRESKIFLAWYGGAPGAASALFLMALTGRPALADADAVIAVGVLAVAAGVFAARLTSQPVLRNYLREAARAERRRRLAA